MKWNKSIFINNIEQLINVECGGLAKAFNERIGQRDAYTRWKQTDTKPKFEAILKICEIFDCDFNWLLAGKETQGTPRTDIDEESPEFCGTQWTEEDILYCKQLKRIFDSKHPVITPMIISNLAAFEHIVNEEKKKARKVKNLEKRIEYLEELNEKDWNIGTGGAE